MRECHDKKMRSEKNTAANKNKGPMQSPAHTKALRCGFPQRGFKESTGTAQRLKLQRTKSSRRWEDLPFTAGREKNLTREEKLGKREMRLKCRCPGIYTQPKSRRWSLPIWRDVLEWRED